MNKVTIYTDGACSGNPGPGGYGVIITDEASGAEKELSGGESRTTNNRMELMGVITGLSALKRRCEVELYSDSKYVVDAINLGWVERWKKNGWMRNKKEPALNIDLWERLLEELEKQNVSFHWVRGHATNELNNRCDALAVAMRDKYTEK